METTFKIFCLGIIIGFITGFCVDKLKTKLVLEMWNKNKDIIPSSVEIKLNWHQYQNGVESKASKLKLSDSLKTHIDKEWQNRGFFGVVAQLRVKK